MTYESDPLGSVPPPVLGRGPRGGPTGLGRQTTVLILLLTTLSAFVNAFAQSSHPIRAPRTYSLPSLADRFQGESTPGVAWFRTAVGNEVNPGEAYLAVGISYKALGRLNEALGAFILAAEFRPDIADAHYRLGSASIAVGESARARSAYEALRSINGELASALLAKIERNRGSMDNRGRPVGCRSPSMSSGESNRRKNVPAGV